MFNRVLARNLLWLLIAAAFVLGLASPGTLQSARAFNTLQLTELGRFTGSGAEISAYDPLTRRLFVTDGGTGIVQVVDLANPANPQLIATLPYAATSVAVERGLLAIAVPNTDPTQPGTVVLMDTLLSLPPLSLQVGVLPDMLTFTPNGAFLLVANEGERANGSDPEGSISVIGLTIAGKSLKANVRTADFTQFNNQRSALVSQGVRIFPDAASVAQDMEPEYIAISPDGSFAWVTLQENNAIALLNITRANIAEIMPLGLKNWNQGPKLDTSDRDGANGGKAILMRNQPVFGMYMPDGITSFASAGLPYFITANEGDARTEDSRISSLALDPIAFPNAATLKNNANLGRLNASSVDGDLDGDGDFDRLQVYGARSFTIWNALGQMVFDSGDQLESLTAALTPGLFNANNGLPADWDTRSDDKGPEPEAVIVGQVNGVNYAFVGMERSGSGVLVYDLTDPTNPAFVNYIRSDVDISVEGLLFIPAEESPNGHPLVILTHEVSSTVTIYQVMSH
jgi:hypothetical protein